MIIFTYTEKTVTLTYSREVTISTENSGDVYAPVCVLIAQFIKIPNMFKASAVEALPAHFNSLDEALNAFRSLGYKVSVTYSRNLVESIRFDK